MGDDIAHGPACTGTGVVPRLGGEGVEVLCELRCGGLAELETMLACVHGVLLLGVGLATSPKAWQLVPTRQPNGRGDSANVPANMGWDWQGRLPSPRLGYQAERSG